jgi:hypothetical protein
MTKWFREGLQRNYDALTTRGIWWGLALMIVGVWNALVGVRSATIVLSMVGAGALCLGLLAACFLLGMPPKKQPVPDTPAA